MQANLRTSPFLHLWPEAKSLFPCLFTLCFSVLCQLTVLSACVYINCHKAGKHRLENCQACSALQNSTILRKAFAERFSVSLWKLTPNANWPQLCSLSGTKEMGKEEPPNKLNALLVIAAFMKTKIGSHLFIHSRYSDSTFCHPHVLLELAVLPGEGLPHSNSS